MENEFISVAAFGDRIDKLLETIRARSDEFQQKLDALPSSKPCPRHPTETATLNNEASFAAEKPVYRCPQCVNGDREAKRIKALDAAGIPQDVRHATLANFEERPGVKDGKGFHPPAVFRDRAQRFLAGEIRNLFLCGTPGIGKGHLGAAIAIQRMAEGQSVVWVECSRLFKDWHEAYEGNSTDAVRDRHAKADLLVLDEICLRDLPQDGEEILFAILDGRQKRGLQTVLLGNKTGEDVKKWLGGRIVDRLRSGKVAFCYGEWESMRGTQGDGANNEF